jgi:hypothetical protein
MKRITKEQAIQQVGEKSVNTLLFANLEPTNRVTTDGTVELSACVDATHIDGDDVTVWMYVSVDKDAFNSCESLDQLNWDAIMPNAKFEITV